MSCTTITSSAAAVQEKKFIWPEDLSTINLTDAERDTIELAIQAFRQAKKSCSDNDTAYIKLKKKVKLDVTTSQGSVYQLTLPRSLIIYKDKSFVRLTGVHSLPGGGQQASLKRVYNPDSGEWFLKKRAFSTEEETIVSFISPPHKLMPQEARDGFTDIPYFERTSRKRAYLEKQYPGSVASLYRSKKNIVVGGKALCDLSSALHTIHSLTYSPPALTLHSSSVALTFFNTHCYHGDISPKNVVYELESPSEDSSIAIKHLRLIDWGAALQLDHIIALPGWNSPEAIRFLQSSHNPPEIQAFNLEYGRKKDAWAFGLLVGSILRGNFIFEPSTGATLPNFSFIAKKIKVTPDGSLDDSELANLKQEEIDAKLTEIVSSFDQSTEFGAKGAMLWKAIGCWLQVDPDKRRDLETTYISLAP